MKCKSTSLSKDFIVRQIEYVNNLAQEFKAKITFVGCKEGLWTIEWNQEEIAVMQRSGYETKLV